MEKYRDWLLLGLACGCVLLMACNVGLWRKFTAENQRRLALEKERQDRKIQLQKRGFQEASLWQAEIAAQMQLEAALQHFCTQKYPQALSCLNQALEYFADIPIAYYLRGYIYAQMQQIDKATADFTTYLDYNPLSVYGYWHRAQLYIRQNRLTPAIADLQQALEQKPHFAAAQQLLQKLQKPENP